MKQPRLGILQTGHSPDELREKHPNYASMFETLLGADAFRYRSWPVVDGEFPESIDDADAWLITGSKHGAYEAHDWIPPLEKLIQDIYAANAPMVGICFGHQIIAQTLGGKVEKYSGGWSVGRVQYTFDSSLGVDDAALLAYHQDQVVSPPPAARTVGSTSFCEHAALVYDNKVLTLQPHPEFNSEFVFDLLETRGKLLPDGVRENALEDLHEPLATNSIGTLLKRFLLQHDVPS